jgi:hypothetical protein
LAPWRAMPGVLGPFMSQRLRPTQAKLDAIITRSLGDGERVNHEFRPCRPHARGSPPGTRPP